MRSSILGGQNTFFIDDDTRAVFTFFADAAGETFIRGGESTSATFNAPRPETTILVTDSGIAASWTDGSAEIDGRGQPIRIAVQPGTTIDLSVMTEAMDYELRISVLFDRPDITIIGALNDNISIGFFEDD